MHMLQTVSTSTNVSNLCVFPCSSSEYLFQLTAVLVHHGDMHSGHFITYRRSPSSTCGSSPFSRQWLWVSDDSVRKASLQEVLSCNAYMLFYERVRRPSLNQRSNEQLAWSTSAFFVATAWLPPGCLCGRSLAPSVRVLCRSGHSMRLVIPKKKELQDFSQILLAIWATFLVEQFFCNRQQE